DLRQIRNGSEAELQTETLCQPSGRGLTSALGHKRDISQCNRHVRFNPRKRTFGVYQRTSGYGPKANIAAMGDHAPRARSISRVAVSWFFVPPPCNVLVGAYKDEIARIETLRFRVVDVENRKREISLLGCFEET